MLEEFNRRDKYEWNNTACQCILARIGTTNRWLHTCIYSFTIEGPLSWIPGRGFVFNYSSGTVYVNPESRIYNWARQRALVVPIARQLAKRLHGVPFEEVAKFLY